MSKKQAARPKGTAPTSTSKSRPKAAIKIPGEATTDTTAGSSQKSSVPKRTGQGQGATISVGQNASTGTTNQSGVLEPTGRGHGTAVIMSNAVTNIETATQPATPKPMGRGQVASNVEPSMSCTRLSNKNKRLGLPDAPQKCHTPAEMAALRQEREELACAQAENEHRAAELTRLLCESHGADTASGLSSGIDNVDDTEVSRAPPTSESDGDFLKGNANFDNDQSDEDDDLDVMEVDDNDQMLQKPKRKKSMTQHEKGWQLRQQLEGHPKPDQDSRKRTFAELEPTQNVLTKKPRPSKAQSYKSSGLTQDWESRIGKNRPYSTSRSSADEDPFGAYGGIPSDEEEHDLDAEIEAAASIRSGPTIAVPGGSEKRKSNQINVNIVAVEPSEMVVKAKKGRHGNPQLAQGERFRNAHLLLNPDEEYNWDISTSDSFLKILTRYYKHFLPESVKWRPDVIPIKSNSPECVLALSHVHEWRNKIGSTAIQVVRDHIANTAPKKVCSAVSKDADLEKALGDHINASSIVATSETLKNGDNEVQDIAGTKKESEAQADTGIGLAPQLTHVNDINNDNGNTSFNLTTTASREAFVEYIIEPKKHPFIYADYENIGIELLGHPESTRRTIITCHHRHEAIRQLSNVLGPDTTTDDEQRNSSTPASMLPELPYFGNTESFKIRTENLTKSSASTNNSTPIVEEIRPEEEDMSGEQSSTPKREPKPRTQEEMIISVATAVLEEKKKDKGVKVATPEPFDGDRKETQRFLTEVEIYLYEELKWDDLKGAFKKHYLPIDIKADAQLRIEDMKMGERADNYVNEFRVLADEAGYDDEALSHIFQKGLPFVLADKILNQPQGRPKDLNGWFQMAVDKKKKFEKKETTVNRMETGRLSEEEHQEYMKDGRCFHCAKQGHLSRDCPMKNSDKNMEKAIKKMPRDGYVKIQAMFKEYSHEEQKELLDIMEKEGF
ncbi:hypothetical protein Moror_8529 [Moniliophthora roreri MCA 2997]|uniref:CCHC-type domain-containing protein n=1 Tax=Moniliophthora roreri (strain MCA 2997) TaxID=1381753 RepID=V2WQH9_MONRO|nr:hypothetical protein Moror_8529 [Moniliophthora roreri MCA 2997]